MSTQIVCVDGYTLNPGDLSWEPFERLGTLTVHDRTSPDQVIERVGDAPCVLTNKVAFDAETIAALPALRYIGVLATGYNIIDTAAADRHGIVVTNVPSYSTDSVAQHTVSLILELARRNAVHDEAVRRGAWSDCPDFCFAVTPIVELSGKTLGIVGMGQIGRAVACIGAAMGMRIAAYSRNPQSVDTGGLQVTFHDLDELFAQADVLSLHCPLTDATRNLVNAERLNRMKPSAFIVNTSRGPLIDEQALLEALRSGRIAGAAVDVLSSEPPPADHPLIGAPNCIITPHVGWYAFEARQRLMQWAADNLRAFLEGNPINVVNQPATTDR